MKVIDLFDDCLLEVFQYLDADGLTNVAESSKHFVYAARDIFRKKYGNELLEVSNTYGLETLKHFGSVINKLEVTSHVFHNMFTECRESLVEITLKSVDDRDFPKFGEPFEKMRTIRIYGGFGAGIIREFNALFPNAEQLALINMKLKSKMDEMCIQQHFPSLQQLAFTCGYKVDSFSVSNLKNAIRLNPQLKGLMISQLEPSFSGRIHINRELLQFVNEQLQQLEVLAIGLTEDTSLSQPVCDLNFGCLKSLLIRFEETLGIPHIYGSRIENLVLEKSFLYASSSRLHGYVNKLFSLNANVNKLELSGYWGGDFPLAQMPEMLPNLIELKILHPIYRYAIGYQKIVWLLENCKQLRKLTIRIRDDTIERLRLRCNQDNKKFGWTMDLGDSDDGCFVFEKEE